MARLNRFGFLAIAVLFHLIYIRSIFDIYFVSPIVHGMRAYGVDRPPSVEAPAKRLVLIVGDGLRADKAFQSFPDPSPEDPTDPAALKPRPLAPFLRSKVLNHGTFGVSHTRVPTESRPGHVALIAGLYEDVSAVMTGWKLNPVNFDSVFNRSRHTWSWGSPDILPMFKEGADAGRVDADMYGEEAEDYTLDATQLDTWVFDKVTKMFASAATDPQLDATLRQDKNVFFLHLLGLDTSGHAYRPYSKEYLHNIKIVDAGVQRMTKLIEDFYNDGKTAFVFTADHGMSDMGSHGDGHPDNTRTPLIAWGSGVASPVVVSKKSIAPGHEDGFSLDWGLNHVKRHDVAQADVAALMAYLVGLDFPVNSVGELPLEYLASEPREKANAALANAKGILEMYHVKEEEKRDSEIGFRPYAAFGDASHSVESRIERITELIEKKKYNEAIESCRELVKVGLEGLRYLQTYDWLFLRAIVTLGYLGWIAFALTTVIDLHVLHGKSETNRTLQSTAAFASVFIALAAVMAVRKSSWTYYAYAIFPVAFWEEVFARRQALLDGKKVLIGSLDSRQSWSLLVNTAIYIAVLEALVQGYFHRQVFSMLFILAAFWPATYGIPFLQQNLVTSVSWAVLCFIMSSFTLLPVVKVESLNQIIWGGALIFFIGILYLGYERQILANSKTYRAGGTVSSVDGIARTVLGAQVGLIGLAIWVTRSSVQSLQAKNGLPLGTQTVAWLVFLASPALLSLHRLQPNNYYLHRLVIIFLAFSPVYIILTISYESLFYVAFCGTLVTWVRLEHQVHKHLSAETATPKAKDKPETSTNGTASATVTESVEPEYRTLGLGDARVALFFIFLLQSAFFSTGNIGSVSSFSLDSVYRLIPVFDPFSQGALLIVKLIVPFVIISANLGILNRRLRVAPSALFMIVMAISDVMTLNFFYMVRDEGSWLDIGTTISHFVIASALCVFVAALESFSELLISGVDVGGDIQDGTTGEGPKELGVRGNGKTKAPVESS
ncbi:MAG: Glycosyl phosphatidyl inositol anchor synthesis [Vezdaea aestivalis]|nr:MAG: Glycosyl phosphatidyl inositol anchor synthesis [Vezdaea aestivalis]